MQHVLSEDVLHLRGEVGEKCSVWLARHALVSARRAAPKFTRLRRDVKNKQLLRALLTCAEAHLRQIDEDETDDLGDVVRMAFDRDKTLSVVQRIVARVHILLVGALNNDFEIFVIPLEVHTYISTENDVIKCSGIVTVIRRT